MSFDTIQAVRHSEAFASASSWLDSKQSLMVDTVINWSHINSGSENLTGLAEMAEAVRTLVGDLGADISTIDLADGTVMDVSGAINTHKNGRILIIEKHREAPVQILLTGHLDTVFPADSAFQETKWLDENTLNGPGVADMKGGILVMLHALMALEASPKAGKVGWRVMLSPDEETGSLASAEHLVAAAKHADLGLTYEPALADGTLAGARKGSGNYSIHVEGRAAHAGRDFDAGRNAVVALADIFVALSKLSHQQKGLTVNPAIIEGGIATNVVPDSAFGRLNIRLEQPEDANWFESELKKIADIWREKEGFGVTIHGGINRPPKVISAENQALMDFVAACGAALDLEVTYKPTGGCCEGNNLADAGLANIDTLGVRGGDIHSAQEYLLVESLSERAKLSTLILMALAEGGLDEIRSAANKNR